MDTNTTLLEKLNHQEKIDLNSVSSCKWGLISIGGLTTLSLATQAFLIHKSGLTSILFIGSLIAGGILLALVYHISKRIASAYIKGDVIIVNYYWGRKHPKVMDLRCVRTIRTKQVLGYPVTSMKFKFDGVVYRAILLGKPSMAKNAENIIKEIRSSAA